MQSKNTIIENQCLPFPLFKSLFIYWKLFFWSQHSVKQKEKNKKQTLLLWHLKIILTLLLHVVFIKSTTHAPLYNYLILLLAKKFPGYQKIKKLLQTSWSFIWMFYNLKNAVVPLQKWTGNTPIHLVCKNIFLLHTI